MDRYSFVGSGYIALLIFTLMTAWSVESARLGEDEAPARAPSTPTATQSGPEAPITPAASTTAEQNILLNFKDVDLRQIIDLMSDLTNQNYLVDDKVRGKVTIISPRPVSREEAYNIFLSILEVQGFTVVPQGAVHKIIPSREVKESPLPTAVDGADRTPSSDRDAFITQLIPLKYADANEIRGLLSALVSKESSLLAYEPTNTLILTEVQSNISRLMKIIRALDVQAPAAVLKVIALKYAAADQMVASLQTALEGLAEAEGDGDESAAATAQQRRRRRAQSQAATSLKRAPTAPKIIADSRTNSLVVIATPAVIMAAEDLIAKLDIPTPEGRGQIHVYYLQHADAEEMAQVLTAQAAEIERTQAAATNTSTTPQQVRAQPQQAAQQRGSAAPVTTGTTPLGITITADKPTNSLVITAPPEAYAVLKEIIEKLDIRRSQVLVEALFAEVTLGTADALGVEWRVIDDPDGGTQVFASSTGTSGETGTGILTTLATAPLAASPTGLIIGALRNTIQINGQEILNIPAVLRAFEGNSDVNILATPNLLTTDNQEATIFIGEERPFLIGEQSDATNINVSNRSFEFRDVGIRLEMTPQISYGKTVRLELKIELKAFVDEAEVGAVVTTNREATTTVVADAGQTIVIGGLIRDDTNESKTGVPCIGNAPLIGWAFRQQSHRRIKNNLLIFITPHILNTPGDIDRITEHKRQQSDRAQEIEKQLQHGRPQDNLEHLLD